ncbi:MAG: hypothetical protein A3D74_05585 [Candidatus Levybacteria bacterium RIFCSPHIGHO2_02_FULL_37_13]|nr:MAG: hypothetical protein A3D74_05585 [Candidatus Levybacteria bacterium RIFCSPHIGHO2_02_FULL_37_13]OGH29115.1 MAG: hypothetical protein A3E40_03145 [Candidatus Levybacteria bacterium RIFCSPHIGHO2_12_FULL_37_9]OGH40416.1 MAG: hypothetical protein A3B41_02810 [Candidatus Levybacteria bacterium RIFCSPLOWO2_01_FULL_37_26]
MHLSTEVKIIGGIGLLTLVILVGGVFFLSKSENLSVPESEIVERNGFHWHPKLTITIKGRKQEIPANLGIGAVHQEIHTHDQDAKDGVIHMEMKGVVTKDETKLKNFFRIWGKEFSSTQIFDETNGPDGKMKMLVNGKANTDFENYQMRDGDKIEVRYE